jgi:mRNA (guanine-N7-)-methyltransferase
MMESETKLRAFFKNVTSRLNPGGFFIGTTVDADELVRRVRASPENNTYQNDFMTVVLP